METARSLGRLTCNKGLHPNNVNFAANYVAEKKPSASGCINCKCGAPFLPFDLFVFLVDDMSIS